MNELVVQPQAALVPVESASVSLMRAIERAAVDPNFDVQKLERLLDVKERWEANEARKAFVAAMAQFKRNPPEIVKNKHVDFTSKSGTRTEYDHATLDAVCGAVIEGLSNVGISHDWETEQANGKIRVTCVLTHVLGHSKRTTLEAPPDDSGGKNGIQAIGSTVAYLERYTLLAATGLAAKGMDDDGRGAGGKKADPAPAVAAPAGYDEWSANLRAVVDEGRERLLKVWKDSPMEMRAHMTTHERSRWETMKADAEKASQPKDAA